MSEKTANSVVDLGFLITPGEVAKFLQIHPRSVWRLVAAGEFPEPIRIGKSGRIVRWRASDLEEFLDSKAVEK